MSPRIQREPGLGAAARMPEQAAEPVNAPADSDVQETQPYVGPVAGGGDVTEPAIGPVVGAAANEPTPTATEAPRLRDVPTPPAPPVPEAANTAPASVETAAITQEDAQALLRRRAEILRRFSVGVDATQDDLRVAYQQQVATWENQFAPMVQDGTMTQEALEEELDRFEDVLEDNMRELQSINARLDLYDGPLLEDALEEQPDIPVVDSAQPPTEPQTPSPQRQPVIGAVTDQEDPGPAGVQIGPDVDPNRPVLQPAVDAAQAAKERARREQAAARAEEDPEEMTRTDLFEPVTVEEPDDIAPEDMVEVQPGEPGYDEDGTELDATLLEAQPVDLVDNDWLFDSGFANEPLSDSATVDTDESTPGFRMVEKQPTAATSQEDGVDQLLFEIGARGDALHTEMVQLGQQLRALRTERDKAKNAYGSFARRAAEMVNYTPDAVRELNQRLRHAQEAFRQARNELNEVNHSIMETAGVPERTPDELMESRNNLLEQTFKFRPGNRPELFSDMEVPDTILRGRMNAMYKKKKKQLERAIGQTGGTPAVAEQQVAQELQRYDDQLWQAYGRLREMENQIARQVATLDDETPTDTAAGSVAASTYSASVARAKMNAARQRPTSINLGGGGF